MYDTETFIPRQIAPFLRMANDNSRLSRRDNSRRAFLKATGVVGVGTTSLAGCLNNITGGDSDRIKLGAINPLSGAAAELGQQVQKVQQSWAENVNQNGGINVDGEQREVNLIEYDDESKNSQARSAMEKLATVDQVSGVVSTFRSSGALAVAPTAKDHSIPTFTGGMTPKVNEPGSYVFRHLPSTAGEVLPNLHLVSNKWDDINKIGVISEEGDWGDDTLNVMNWWFREADNTGDYMDLGRFSFSQSDFSSFITKIENQYDQGNIDAVYIQTWASAMEQFMIQQDRAGLNDKMPIIAGTGLADWAGIENIGEGMENSRSETQTLKVIKAADNPGLKDSIDDEVWEQYQKYVSQDLPAVPIALQAYTWCESMAGAIQAAGSTAPEDIREALVSSEEGFLTSIGRYKFRDNGQPEAPISTVKFGYKGDKPVITDVLWDGILPPIVNIPPEVDINF